MTDKEMVSRYDKLGLSPKEKLELLAYDREVESGSSHAGVLTGEQAKIEKKMRSTGTKVYKFATREKKADKPKERIIAAVRSGVESSFNVLTTEVKPGRQFSFSLDGETYEITLTRKRVKKD